MMKLIDADEVVLYRLQKSKMPILFMIIFFPIWLYFGFIFLNPLIRAILANDNGASPSETYLAGLIGLIVFIPLVIVIILSYFLNQLIITDKRVYIRNGLIGRSHIVNLGDIRSFQHVVSRGRNNTNHSILFYLHCGRVLKTGNLYVTLRSLQALLERLREKFEGRGFTRQELGQFKEQNTDAGQPLSKTNVFILILFLTPWLLALILTVSYLGSHA